MKKLLLSLLLDKESRNKLLTIVGIVLFGSIFMVAGLFNILSTGADSNDTIIKCSFSCEDIPPGWLVTSNQSVQSITEIRDSLQLINTKLTTIPDIPEDKTEDPPMAQISPTEILWYQSVFFAMYYASPQPSSDEIDAFLEQMQGNNPPPELTTEITLMATSVYDLILPLLETEQD